MWFPLEDVIDTTDGLRWVDGKARMRLRRARPRLKATEALKEGNVRFGDFSRVVSSSNYVCSSLLGLRFIFEDHTVLVGVLTSVEGSVRGRSDGAAIAFGFNWNYENC
jgi:hypothetical protein